MEQEINPGLEGIVVAATKISHVDGTNGELIYRGYMLEELVWRHCSYEDVLFLLLRGHLPSSEESQYFTHDLAQRRLLSPQLTAMILAMPKNLDPMDALRSIVSALPCEMDTQYPPTEEQALNCIAKIPTILSNYYRLSTKQNIVTPDLNLSHVANYLYMLTGIIPAPEYAKALEVYFISTIEHGMNASTFTARVSTSTQSDLISSIAAAISTLKGPLHGGAPSEVIDMFQAIGTKENVEPWIRAKLEKRERLMGFGHRVYKTYDPRAKVLQDALQDLPAENTYLELSRHIEAIAVPLLKEHHPKQNLYPNVEFGAATLLQAIDLPKALYPATFAISRCAGWAAHSIELSQANRLIRPSSHYIGPMPEAILRRKGAGAFNQNPSFWSKTPEKFPEAGLLTEYTNGKPTQAK